MLLYLCPQFGSYCLECALNYSRTATASTTYTQMRADCPIFFDLYERGNGMPALTARNIAFMMLFTATAAAVAFLANQDNNAPIRAIALSSIPDQ